MMRGVLQSTVLKRKLVSFQKIHTIDAKCKQYSSTSLPRNVSVLAHRKCTLLRGSNLISYHYNAQYRQRFYHPGIVEARIRNAPCPFLPQMIVKFLPRQRPGAEAGPHLQIEHGLNTPGSQARSSKQSTQPNGGKFEARAPMPGEVRSVSSWTRVIKIFRFCPDLTRKRPKTRIRRC